MHSGNERRHELTQVSTSRHPASLSQATVSFTQTPLDEQVVQVLHVPGLTSQAAAPPPAPCAVPEEAGLPVDEVDAELAPPSPPIAEEEPPAPPSLAVISLGPVSEGIDQSSWHPSSDDAATSKRGSRTMSDIATGVPVRKSRGAAAAPPDLPSGGVR